jgi:hypothetical protein
LIDYISIASDEPDQVMRNVHRNLFITASCIILVLACRPPVVAPSEALAAQKAAAELPESKRLDYLEGFKNGAAMVTTALEENRKPFFIRFGGGYSTARPLGALPDGAAVVEDPPAPEFDFESGLSIRYVHGDFTVPFARGQVDGFAWAFNLYALDLAKRGFIQPRQRPMLPAVWTAWPANQQDISTSRESTTVYVHWAPGLLAWQTISKGFPPQRHWRPAPAWMRPSHVALIPDTLWLETQGQGAVALDLTTGVILDVRPAQTHPAEIHSLKAYIDEQKAEMREPEQVARVKELRARAIKGEAQAMYELASLLVEDDTEADGSSAKILWMLESARRGNVPAMMYMASFYYSGHGVPQDISEAHSWSQRAARTGNPAAQTAFSTMFPAN